MMTALIAGGLSTVPSQAYTLSLQESGGNVIATGTGAINLFGLNAAGTGSFTSRMTPSHAFIFTGTNGDPLRGYFTTTFTGPSSFGSGLQTLADSGAGDFIGLGFISINFLAFDIPLNYVSNDPLSSSATWLNKDFNDLGVTPGTYVWAWGTGENQNFTLQIQEPTAAPETGYTFGLLLLALIALFGARHHCFLTRQSLATAGKSELCQGL